MELWKRVQDTRVSLGSSVKKPDIIDRMHHMCDHMSIIKYDEHMPYWHCEIIRQKTIFLQPALTAWTFFATVPNQHLDCKLKTNSGNLKNLTNKWAMCLKCYYSKFKDWALAVDYYLQKKLSSHKINKCSNIKS